jgi:hypothetical protein
MHPRSSTRRDFLRLGSLVAAGTMSGWTGLRDARAMRIGTDAPGSGKARSCILIYLLGGPPHLDMWDLKPARPAEIRGPFQPIATGVTGMQICEQLPRLAGMADKFAILRAVSCPNSEHTSMIYYTLTGRPRPNSGVEDTSLPRRTDFPHIGSVVARLKPPARAVPAFVTLPEVGLRVNGFRPGRVLPLRGGRAGFLGAALDPLAINEDPRSPEALPGLSLPRDVAAERFQARQALLAAVESRAPDNLATRGFGELRRMGVHLTGSSNKDQSVYELRQEPAALRQRYGEHRFGQSLLLARRFVEAGVPMVAIHFNNMTRCDGWDMHGTKVGSSFEDLKEELLPMLDQGFSALLEDLEARGLLSQTAVACMGEFGRTPRIGGSTGVGSRPNGRDHWGPCHSFVLAGGGVRGGQVVGASDKDGAYPREGKVDPADVHATLYHCLGIDPAREIHDQEHRPHRLCAGQVIERLIQ